MPVEEENKCPFDPPVAWARYEFHLKGGKYRGAEMDKQFMEDFQSGKIAPGLWESLYAEKERLESEKVVNCSSFVDGASYSQEETPRPKYKPPREWEGDYEHWERYDYHQEQDPEMLAQGDLDFTNWYKTTSEYEAVFGPKKNTRLLSVK